MKLRFIVMSAMATALLTALSYAQDSAMAGGGAGVAKPKGGAKSEELIEPKAVRSRDGVLDLTLTAAPANVTVGGQTFRSNVYNGSYLGPTLFISRNDQIRLRLENRTGPADAYINKAEPTNLHFHGMAIPPVKPADYIYMAVTPQGAAAEEAAGHDGHPLAAPRDVYAGSFNYAWQLPADHALGEYWYHPHTHGLVEGQVLGGMSGLIVVDGLVSGHYPELAGLRERVLVLKEMSFPGAPEDAPPTKLVNGQLNPTIRMQPGEWQVWHVGNLGGNAFFDVGMDAEPVWILAQDGNLLEEPRKAESVFVPPSGRATLVVGGLEPGRYALRSQFVDTGPQGDPNPDVVIATLDIRGEPIDGAATAARLEQPAVDLEEAGVTEDEVRAMPITRRRIIEFSETADGDTFYINGRMFDPNRNDAVVELGDVEEWTIRNVSGELHTFHIHQLDFLVTHYQGEEYDTKGLRDVVDVPYQRDGKPGEVKLIIPFTNPVIVGRFPYHCHLLEHEDNGMMANLVVRPRGATSQ